MIKIYKIEHPETGYVGYIGQTRNALSSRLATHIREAFRKKTPNDKDSWLIDIVKSGLYPFISIVDEVQDDEADARELTWISKYPDALNIALTNSNRNSEFRRKLSDARMGKDNPNYGKSRPRTQQEKDNTSKALLKSDKFKASRSSPEYRAKITAQRANPVLTLNSDLNVVGEFSSAKSCADYFGYTYANVKNAIRNTRQIGKSSTDRLWVVRKSNLEESKLIILERGKPYGKKV